MSEAPEAKIEAFEDLGFSVRILSANIGNGSNQEKLPQTPWLLSSVPYETYLSDQIQSLKPDIIGFQEVMNTQACANYTGDDSDHTCFDYLSKEPAIRRLTGPDYSIVCDNRAQWECLAVHTSFATIDGLSSGGLDLTGAETPLLPAESCIYGVNCKEDLCDQDSTVSAITITLTENPEIKIRLSHAHPNAPDIHSLYAGITCRTRQLQQLFGGYNGARPLIRPELRNIVIGDFNYDPSLRVGNIDPLQKEHDLWDIYVSTPGIGNSDAPRRFSMHNARKHNGQIMKTIANLLAYDHVLTDFATGECELLGKSGASSRLDAGFEFDSRSELSKLDHDSVLCDLSI